jgi:hypothetical protein
MTLRRQGASLHLITVFISFSSSAAVDDAFSVPPPGARVCSCTGAWKSCTFVSLFNMGVRRGVAMDSLNLHPPCFTLLRPAGGRPLKRPYGHFRGGNLRPSSTPLDTPRRLPLLFKYWNEPFDIISTFMREIWTKERKSENLVKRNLVWCEG